MRLMPIPMTKVIHDMHECYVVDIPDLDDPPKADAEAKSAE